MPHSDTPERLRTKALPFASLNAAKLAERALLRRAIEVAIWGMPMVIYDLMLQAAHKAGAVQNQIVYWSRPPDWLTPNPNCIYFMPFYDTAEAGAIVIDIPPADDGSIAGTLMDCWQTQFAEVGPAGVDEGEGGKYLILPPDYDPAILEGTMTFRSRVYQGYGVLRSILKGAGDAAIASAIAYGKRIRLYPLSTAADPAPTMLVDASDTMFDAILSYDISFFRTLDRMVQSQPWLERDRVMIEMVRSIGIEKGKSFEPDAASVRIMTSALQEARAWFDPGYGAYPS